MLHGYHIIDADAHVTELYTMWQEYLEPAFKHFAPSPDLKVDGELIYHNMTPEVGMQGIERMMQAHPRSVLRGFDAASHVSAMQQMGIDIAVLYPTYIMWLIGSDGLASEVTSAYTRAYNNWLRDFCSYDPQRLKGVGFVNLRVPDEMVAQVRQAVEWGWHAVCLIPNPVQGRRLSDVVYEPLWQACEELQVAVGIHTGTHIRLPTAGADRFDTHFGMHACSHPFEQMIALLALIEGGVLERYPKLKVAFLEAGCGWLPYWLWRLDEEYEILHREVGDSVKMKPSEYFRRQCFISMEPSEPYLERVIDAIGDDSVICGSDYPHTDHDPQIFNKAIALEAQLSSPTLRKIFWDNPARLYGLA